MAAGEMYSRVPVHFFWVYPVPLPSQKHIHSPNQLLTLNIRFPRLHSMAANHSLFFFPSRAKQIGVCLKCLACNSPSKLRAFHIRPAPHVDPLTNLGHLEKKKVESARASNYACDKRQLSHFFFEYFSLLCECGTRPTNMIKQKASSFMWITQLFSITEVFSIT